MTDYPPRFRDVALSVLADISSELVSQVREGGEPELSYADQQRLFNAAMACTELGASQDEITLALRSGFAEGETR